MDVFIIRMKTCGLQKFNRFNYFYFPQEKSFKDFKKKNVSKYLCAAYKSGERDLF